ncbi:hypothetical protein ABES03_10990 [Neobacillus rhizosphaerae]|uniref:hypothetical protein n=1 Tax=Neobacillus rhizosphaerae TaxID=2880965 RepID=UPI003D2A6A5E
MDDYNSLYTDSRYRNFDKEAVELYVKLQRRLKTLNNIKLLTLGSFLAIIVWQTYHDNSYIFENTIGNQRYILSLLIAYTTNHIISFFLHFFAYKNVENKPYKYFYVRGLSKIVFLLFSPDYFYALLFKNTIKENNKNCNENWCNDYCLRDNDGFGICLKAWDYIKIKNKFFIEFSNWGNVIISIVLLISSILYRLSIDWLLYSIYLLIILRTISRGIEVIYAFYKDIANVNDKIFSNKKGNRTYYVHGWKNSLLLKSSRISLAVHTLLEFIFLYSVNYYFLSRFISGEYLSHNMVATQYSNFINFLFYSFSVSMFNFSFTSFPSIYWMLAHIFQISLSFILTILSIAGYLGINSNMLERDNKFYIETHRLLKLKSNVKKKNFDWMNIKF